jgi:putative flippase GtrA
MILIQFLRFGTVGLIGLAFAAAIVYALRAPLGLYWAGIFGFGMTATITWGLNRLWTFRGHNRGPVHRQWALYLLVNLVGFSLNWSTYAALVTFVRLCAAQPVFAVAAGSMAGALANFLLARAMVFPTAVDG